NNAFIAPGVSVYSQYDGLGSSEGYRVSRDLDIQGLEANLVSFGWMGGVRQGQSCNQGLGNGRFSNLGGIGNGRYGGFGGPLTRSGGVQVTTSHGFRWFQLEDAFEFASNTNTVAGYQADDMYYNVDTENNLFGYQFGSKLNYCLTDRLMLNAGGKIGIYGNDYSVSQRLGTETTLAYLTSSGVDDVLTKTSDTGLSALGELDLGLGYRMNNAWTLTGGYRLMSACGVATAPGSIATDYNSIASIAEANADDCLILHGGYVGLQYNW
ncbi:MAG: BBP7 family outer membrane beta-barrel protein, partial [Pirellulaceae bacterium]